MKIYFATWLFEFNHGVSLTKKRANTRLLSYHFLTQQEISEKELDRYTTTGRLKVTKNKKK